MDGELSKKKIHRHRHQLGSIWVDIPHSLTHSPPIYIRLWQLLHLENWDKKRNISCQEEAHFTRASIVCQLIYISRSSSAAAAALPPKPTRPFPLLLLPLFNPIARAYSVGGCNEIGGQGQGWVLYSNRIIHWASAGSDWLPG